MTLARRLWLAALAALLALAACRARCIAYDRSPASQLY